MTLGSFINILSFGFPANRMDTYILHWAPWGAKKTIKITSRFLKVNDIITVTVMQKVHKGQVARLTCSVKVTQ